MRKTPLKIYTDRCYLPPAINHCQLLIPFWGDNGCEHDGYTEFQRVGRNFLTLSPSSEADCAVLPFDGSILINKKDARHDTAVAMANRFVRACSITGLKTIILVNSDSDKHIEIPNTVVIRTSLNRRTRRKNEFALPAWHDDLENYRGGEVSYLEWKIPPAIGFCGHVVSNAPPISRQLKIMSQNMCRMLGVYFSHNDGIFLRRDAINSLSRIPEIKTEFIARQTYFGGAIENPQDAKKIRREYVDNLAHNDYSLCVRGYGNFSFRFFEAMSLGRIPLLLDTECVLPYDFLHDYRDYCLIVPEDRINSLPRILLNFHRKFDADSFLSWQKRVRDFWLNWLSPQGFFSHISLHL